MKAHLYKGMLFLSQQSRFSPRSRRGVDSILKQYLDEGMPENEAKWRCQVFSNHIHLSRTKARKKITEVRRAITDESIKRKLTAVWRESNEYHDAVYLSFYLDW